MSDSLLLKLFTCRRTCNLWRLATMFTRREPVRERDLDNRISRSGQAASRKTASSWHENGGRSRKELCPVPWRVPGSQSDHSDRSSMHRSILILDLVFSISSPSRSDNLNRL